MTSASTLLRSLLVYGLCLPLAVFLGYLLATPMDPTTFTAVGMVLFVLMIPLLLRWHHPWLIASWNMTAVIFFLPGHPQLWMGLTAISLLISILQYALNRERRFLSVPSVTWSLVFLALVVLLTARLTGGIGLRAFGSEVYGGKRYFLVLGAILGYFAITGRRIPPQRATLYVSLFFLGYTTLAIGNLAGMINPAFNFLFFIFPVENLAALDTDPIGRTSVIMRSGGLTMLGMGVFCALLARYNLRQLFDLRNPLRLLVFLIFVFIGTLGGFRSLLAQFLLLVTALFWLEGLYRTRVFPVAIAFTVVGGALLMAFAIHLPLSVQRTLAFLPIPIDQGVKLDAQYSTEWRLKMWEDVLPEVPRYLLLGKGYGFNPGDVNIARMSLRSQATAEGSELVGDYHNGPLSIIIPFGILGVFCFVWFAVAAGRVFYRNYKYGEPAYDKLNTFLFAFYLAKLSFFLTLYGSLYGDLATFVGLLGLSISLNGGAAKPQVVAPEPTLVLSRFRLSPGVRKPVSV